MIPGSPPFCWMTCSAIAISGLCPCCTPPLIMPPSKPSSSPMIFSKTRPSTKGLYGVLRSGRVRAGENPQRIARQLEPALARCGRSTVTAQAQGAQLEQILAPVTQEHARDQFGADAIVRRAVGDLRAFEADDAGRRIAGLEIAARRAPQPPSF